MINLIGAYIVTIFLIAIVIDRKRILPVLDALETLPPAGRIAAFTLLLPLALMAAYPEAPPALYFLHWPFMLLYGFTLWVHEAGHVYFSFFGAFLTALGGTLSQLLFPALLALYAWHTQRKFLSALAVYWVGFSLIGISVYAGDARTRRLPLLGATSGTYHDWYNILSAAGLLEYDRVIALCFLVWGAGMVLFAAVMVGRRR